MRRLDTRTKIASQCLVSKASNAADSDLILNFFIKFCLD